ncbi:MAG TPA: replication-associated recombination protein A [Nitriliruptorales bacterium]|nr:replication-associated recombination protein A [Nitriliruptorales bacterium]
MERLFDDPTAVDPDRPSVLPPATAPLAARMRPRSLDQFVGQEHAVGDGTPLRTLLARDALSSIVLWGPPGSGKTSLAAVVAATTAAAWEELSAVSAGVKDVRAVIERARERRQATGRRTLLFIDEIHRFNKAQQDALLPAVENGWVTLVGATTENPFFELNAPLLSRCLLVRLEPLDEEAVTAIVQRALTDPEHGYGGRVQLEEAALRHLVATADGDARTALVTLEAAVEAATRGAARGVAPGTRDLPGEGTPQTVDIDDVATALASRRLRYDKAADQHYDQVSAFIKSLRGSDPDAAVYWLVRMLEAGQDPRFLARRMVIFASEDVGLADHTALPTAVAAFEALDRVGLPEARFNLAQAAIALATAPKSDSVKRALGAADTAVQEAGNAPVPVHLRDAHYRSAFRLGHGVGYRYPHDYAGAHVAQQYLPDELVGQVLYEPTQHGDEVLVAERLRAWRGGEPAGARAPEAEESAAIRGRGHQESGTSRAAGAEESATGRAAGPEQPATGQAVARAGTAADGGAGRDTATGVAAQVETRSGRATGEATVGPAGRGEAPDEQQDQEGTT